ncbi:MAG: PEGA domain-containing protein [Methanoregula sp.]
MKNPVDNNPALILHLKTASPPTAAGLYHRTRELSVLIHNPDTTRKYRTGTEDCEEIMPKIVRTTTRGAVVLIVLLVLFSGAVAAGQTQAYMGSVVTLSGYSYTGNTVFLFLTGPNLPPNGVALDNINRLADQGGATQVDVDGDGHWVYQWNTGALGLDAGSYTVWVADGPADVSRLSAVDYRTISVILSEPFITAGTSGGPGQSSGQVQAGSINLSSIPDGTSVVVNNVYKGRTPLNVSGLDPGTYNVTFSHFGYARLSTPVTVQAGSVSEVNATLVMLTGSLFVNTTPAGAQLTLDGLAAGISPATLPNLPQGNHTLNVTKDGFVTQILPVLITADQTTAVNVVLVPAGMFDGSGTRAAGFLPSTVVAGVLVAMLFAVKNSRK